MVSNVGASVTISHANSNDVSRISGSDRYDTCVEISKKSFDKANLAIITSGENYPDALSSGAFAAKYNSPLLLVKKDEIPDSVLKEMKRLGIKEVKIVGGENTISKMLLEKLEKDYKVERISGEDRFATSVEVAKKSEDKEKVVEIYL